jgi:hypothetical protein
MIVLSSGFAGTADAGGFDARSGSAAARRTARAYGSRRLAR